jgi:hypothetical protein
MYLLGYSGIIAAMWGSVVEFVGLGAQIQVGDRCALREDIK